MTTKTNKWEEEFDRLKIGCCHGTGWESEELHNDQIKSFIHTQIQKSVKEERERWKEKIEGMKKDKRIPYQALRFGDCPNCGQEVNRKWVEKECLDIRNQALTDILSEEEG